MKHKVFFLTVTFIAALTAVRADNNPADAVAQGKQLVEQKKCSICHSIDGKGGKIGKPLNGVAEGKTDDFLGQALLDPKKAIAPDTKMPSYKDKLKAEEVKAVVEYLKSLKKQ
jgi:mono/diheme cytochrome c family protein